MPLKWEHNKKIELALAVITADVISPRSSKGRFTMSDIIETLAASCSNIAKRMKDKQSLTP
ncbi:hypothetical protein [Bartonella choladocola]|uniref:hypothetical protein n=1 Tax=Bartonella choladocola TaxID=2750995 RepID=UPI00122E9F78|nr:hypothetical protein [Bartonella choladocola]